MPEITVSEKLYEKLETEAAGGEIEDTLWEMVGSYQRAQHPESEGS
jgi:hypothetical protein